MHPSLIRDQSDPTPNSYYSAFRYLDRMFEPKRTHRRAEISSIDLDDLSFEVKYLMRHLLILKGQYRDALTHYPNLRGLEVPDLRVVIDPPLFLSERPRHSWSYLKHVGIYL